MRLSSRFWIVALLFVLLIWQFPVIASGQQRMVRQGPDPIELTPQQKKGLLDALKRRVEEVYVFPNRVPDLHAYLDRQMASGAYDDISDGIAFASMLTADLRRHTGDLHFAVTYEPDRFDQIERMRLGPNPALRRFDASGEASRRLEPGDPRFEAMFDRMRRTNFNLRKLEILDGNVGYLRIDMMPPLEMARPTVDAAMQFLAHSDALIIDLRSSPGGVGGFISYLMSYFFPADSLLLYTREFAFADRVESYYTSTILPAPRLATQPIYILTSAMTGSAAENLAYTLQQHDRAHVVGEATAGAAHSASVAQLQDGFIARIPIARVVHPISSTNWDRTGVIPDIESGASLALSTAHDLALTKLLQATSDRAYRAELDAIRARVRVARSQAESEREAALGTLEEYAGTYGSRTITVRDGALHYQRAGGPQVRLARVEGDLFRFDLDPNMRSPTPLPHIRFDRNATGEVVSITAINQDGSVREVFEKLK